MSDRLTVTVPGKLVLLGEYAVLAPGEPGIVLAVAPGLTAEWAPADVATVAAPDLNVPATPLADAQTALPFVHRAWEVIREVYGADPGGALVLRGDLAIGGRKLGLGGSASATVAAVRAWLQAMEETVSAEEVYRLAAVAHHRQQGNGSGIDVAAASFGGVGCYRSPGGAWLGRLQGRAILTEPLPVPVWEALRLPEGLTLAVGFTGESARTAPAVDKVLAWAASHPEDWRIFLDASRHAVTMAIGGLHAGLASQVYGGMRINRRILQGLGESAGVNVETSPLAQLADAAESLGGSGKPSGAGGGDCGVAFTPPVQAEALLQRWAKHGIQPVAVTPAEPVAEPAIV